MVDGQKKLAKNFKKVAHEKTGVPDGTDIPDELKEVLHGNHIDLYLRHTPLCSGTYFLCAHFCWH